jgi:hypothetical protein
MDTTDRLSAAWLLLACGVACALLVIAALPAWVQAEGYDLPPRPPTATPIPPEKPGNGARSSEHAGAWIQLHFQPPAQSPSLSWPELWTAVQWQDTGGRWHEVEGWRGTLDDAANDAANGVGSKVWWVAKRDLGTGPFRWIVRHEYGGDLLAGSESFYLPGTAGETLQVEVLLTP